MTMAEDAVAVLTPVKEAELVPFFLAAVFEKVSGTPLLVVAIGVDSDSGKELVSKVVVVVVESANGVVSVAGLQIASRILAPSSPASFKVLTPTLPQLATLRGPPSLPSDL